MTRDNQLAVPVKGLCGIQVEIYFDPIKGDSVHLDICHLDGTLISSSEFRPDADGLPPWMLIGGLLLSWTLMPIMQAGLPVFWGRLVEKAKKAEVELALQMAKDLTEGLSGEAGNEASQE